MIHHTSFQNKKSLYTIFSGCCMLRLVNETMKNIMVGILLSPHDACRARCERKNASMVSKVSGRVDKINDSLERGYIWLRDLAMFAWLRVFHHR
jgi:hypothetical protein